MVRPAVTYGAGTWFSPNKERLGQMEKIQSAGLRTVTGGFKATPKKRLENEAFMVPINLHLESLTIATQQRLEETGRWAQIRTACEKIANRLRNRGRGRPRGPLAPTPGQSRKAWVDQTLREHTTRGRPPTAKEVAMQKWTARATQQAEEPSLRNGFAVKSLPDKKNLRIYEDMRKAESSVIFQVRTGVIGLNYFLKRRRVPGIDSELCRCGFGPETAVHMAVFCGEYEESRRWLEDRRDGMVHWSELVGTPAGARRLARWMIQQGRIEQFSLANRLLY